VDVLVAEGEGRKDDATHRITGRAADNRLVHVALPAGLPAAERPRPGDMVTATVTHGAPHHLVADSAPAGGTYLLRRTRAGDAWDRRQGLAEEPHSHGEPAPAGPITLGIPTLRR
jgi:tRNA-2-methylthio-N6-dimethylallyladenosine synthase